MLQKEQNRVRTSWARRIEILLRVAEVWQLREILYMVGASRSGSRGQTHSRCPDWTHIYKNICF